MGGNMSDPEFSSRNAPNSYTIDIGKFCKIWFSKNPNEFLGIKNQLRLIQLRGKHPEAEITFVYSAHCLSESAQKELMTFCKKHKIKAVDFDTEIKAALQNSSDETLELKIYQLAMQEINKTLDGSGGNLAAASDGARLLEVVARYGIYSDYDVELDFSTIKQRKIKFDKPIMIQASVAEEPYQYPQVNNEFLAIAEDDNDPGRIHPDAGARLTILKQRMLANYENPLKALKEGLVNGLSDMAYSLDPTLLSVIEKFFEKNPKADIFTFRQYIEQLDLVQYLSALPAYQSKVEFGYPFDLSMVPPEVTEAEILAKAQEQHGRQIRHQLWQQIKAIKKYDPLVNTLVLEKQAHQRAEDLSAERIALLQHMLYLKSVTHMSGPVILKHLFVHSETEFSENVRQTGLIGSKVEVIPAEEFRELLENVKCYSVEKSLLKGCVHSANFLVGGKDISSLGKNIKELIGTTGDQSWTPLGAAKQQAQQATVEKSVKYVQRIWRKSHPKKP